MDITNYTNYLITYHSPGVLGLPVGFRVGFQAAASAGGPVRLEFTAEGRYVGVSKVMA